jgi:hypothetical protein
MGGGAGRLAIDGLAQPRHARVLMIRRHRSRMPRRAADGG